MAQLKLIEFLAAENPDIFIASVHPGIVMTDMLKAGVPLEQREEWTKDKGNNLFDDGGCFVSSSVLICGKRNLRESIIWVLHKQYVDTFDSEAFGAFHPLDDEFRGTFLAREVRVG